MAASKKGKFLTKTTKFGREKVTLYSLDGLTWSSRPKELEEIKARHEAARVTFAQIKGEVKAAASEEEPEREEEKSPARDDGPVEVLSQEEREMLDVEDESEEDDERDDAPAAPAEKIAKRVKDVKLPDKPAKVQRRARTPASPKKSMPAKPLKGKRAGNTKARRAA